MCRDKSLTRLEEWKVSSFQKTAVSTELWGSASLSHLTAEFLGVGLAW